ncbi:MAG TPA: NAD(P)H-dependent oxidoreductase subunit E [Armatimonadota bacterium]|nr:NAD(P)H-dependent oxidoreductase subunit E [Armatimonadota bacterium]
MAKLRVTICAGTTCYVMGGSHLHALEEHLRPEDAGRVEIMGARCLGMCKEGQFGRAPYVRINDEVMAEVTLPKLIHRIEELLAEPEEQG